eukprot:13235904-Alexandrium_andersonii.AAC.1
MHVCAQCDRRRGPPGARSAPRSVARCLPGDDAGLDEGAATDGEGDVADGGDGEDGVGSVADVAAVA